jgi:hypothetical protein
MNQPGLTTIDWMDLFGDRETAEGGLSCLVSRMASGGYAAWAGTERSMIMAGSEAASFLAWSG